MLGALNVLFEPHKIPMWGVKNPIFTVGKVHVQRDKVSFPMSYDEQRAEQDLNVFIIIHWTKTLKSMTKSTYADFGIKVLSNKQDASQICA